MDKLCISALAALWVAVGGASLALEAEATPETAKPLAGITWTVTLDCLQVPKTIAQALEQCNFYRDDIPLAPELQAVLREVCAENGVPVSLALGLIQEESSFCPDVVSGKGAYGLCQINPKYFSSDLDPAGNITAGVGYLGKLLSQHGDPAAALRAYNLGYDDGDRRFASAVLAAAERWEDGTCIKK
jgi:hypothetical protein